MITVSSHRRIRMHGKGALAILLGTLLSAVLVVAVQGAPAQAGVTGQWQFTGSMATGHNNWWNSGFVQLPDGRVLAISGSPGTSGLTSAAEIYDPGTGQWTPAGSLNDARYAFGPPSVLPDGDVLVAGGHDANVVDYATAELYDPATSQWTFTGSLNTSRRYPVQVELANGEVLVATGSHGPPTCTRYLSSAELYNPATGQWAYTGSTLVPRESATAIRLADGRVLLAGGYNGSGPGCTDATPADTEIYDPSTGQWSFAGNLPHGWLGGAMVLLPDHRVLMVDGNQQGSPAFAEAVIFDPATNQWSKAATPILPRSGAAATLLPDGDVLVSQGGQLQSEIYDPTTNTWSLDATTLDTNNGGHTFLLPDGKVLLAGGGNSAGATTTTELYAPASSDDDLAIATPAGVTADATSTSGATISYPLPPVTDPDDATTPAPGCSPAPGSVFPIGTTTVTCTATDPDDSNSPVTTSFTITVKGAAAQLADLYQAVQGAGTGTSLADKIAQAQSYLAAGDITDASSTLDAFIHEVTAQSGNSIPSGLASQLIAEARQIQALLHPTVFMLMQGIDSSLTATNISQQVTPDFGSVKSAIQAEYPSAQFITYSYAGPNKAGDPSPYTCVSTLTTPLSAEIQVLSQQIQAVLAKEPNADIYLVAHSMGGIIAYGYLAALEETTGIVASLPGSNLKGVITLDSPIGGISNDDTYFTDAVSYYELACSGVTGILPSALRDMSTIFASTSSSTPPDSSAADSQGAQASILSIPFSNVTIPQPYPSNQQVAEDASANGIRVLSVGNTNDLLWQPSACPGGAQDFTDTQWLEDEGSNSGIYAREFTSGTLNCYLALPLNRANHFDVLSDPDVMQAIQEFIDGGTPSALSVAPPGSD